MGRDKKEPTEPVRLPVHIVKKARMISAHRDVSIPDYLAEIVEEIINADYEAMVRELVRKKQNGH